MALERNQVSDFRKVGTRTVSVVKKGGIRETKTVENYAPVIVNDSGRRGYAVAVTGIKGDGSGDIAQVIVRLTDCPAGDFSGEKLIASGEQRQFFPEELSIFEEEEVSSEVTTNE